MATALPRHDQYDIPENVRRNFEKRQAAISGGITQKVQSIPTKYVDHFPEEDIPVIQEDDRRDKPHVPTSSLSDTAVKVISRAPTASDRLLCWYGKMLGADSHYVSLDMNGLTVEVKVSKVEKEDGRIVVLVPAETGVSFSLAPGSKIKFKMPGSDEFIETVFLAQLNMGPGFPFLFMVFLE